MRAQTGNPEPAARAVDRLLGRNLALGDESALAEVYDRYARTVYGIAVRVTADRVAAEDITQEVFSQVWDQAHRFDPERGSLRAWVTTIAHRRAVDWVRHEVAQRRLQHPVGRTEAPSAEEESVHSYVAERVRAAVQRLPSAQRKVVLMAYYEGCTMKEVAMALGVPEGTAKSRMRVALLKLNERLAAEGLVPA